MCQYCLFQVCQPKKCIATSKLTAHKHPQRRNKRRKRRGTLKTGCTRLFWLVVALDISHAQVTSPVIQNDGTFFDRGVATSASFSDVYSGVRVEERATHLNHRTCDLRMAWLMYSHRQSKRLQCVTQHWQSEEGFGVQCLLHRGEGKGPARMT